MFFGVRPQLQSLLMHVVIKWFAVTYAVIPLDITDSCPEIIGHPPSVLHLKIWAFIQNHLDPVSLKEEFGQNYHSNVFRPQL